MTDEARFDVAVVGGGPAGLSAALVLARARRRVAVFDDGRPRNAAAREIHGLLGHDGTPPGELLRIGRAQLGAYETATFIETRIVDACLASGGFELTDRDGRRYGARRLVIATGVQDRLPPFEGAEALYGVSVHHCPYCDGWENRDRPLAVWGWDDAHGGGLALELTAWSRDVVMLTHGSAGFSAAMRERLARHGVAVRDERVVRLEAEDGRLRRVLFEDGPPLPRHALFFFTERRQSSDLAARLGCDDCGVSGCVVGPNGRTNVPGCHVIGDASRDVLQVAVAIGEGVQAACAINRELLDEQLS